ncbi:1-acylglycerol-3-phosphate O-acyltransferase PNPLA3 isoform X2 [Meles meles]|uniref:1-acylglycerol-3-phosphate O-acyltransferase PNPLA3 isoform X2 n=1 Tax=Meles meles TaxID=9662 RepID=UPI001E6A0EEB|nr:1-acylglycerol-3-phosphate O-acyltransferase PNPLA3 isoform X2 [Meles meles]
MYDPERGWSLSFSGCGFLGFYHIGVTRCLSERAPHLVQDARMLFGSSAGALHGVALLSGISLDSIMEILMDLVQSARNRKIGILHPAFNLGRRLRNDLQTYLPDDIHRLISGKMYISLTRVSDGKNVLVSDFRSKEEVVDRYMDGGASDNTPFLDAKTTITVSPFYGEYDICPKVKSTNFLHVDITKLSLRLCSENAYLLMRALFPPDLKVLGEICLRGYLDAFRFLEENGVCNKPHPGLDLPSAEAKPLTYPWGHRSPESGPRVSAEGTEPEGDELLDHLRLSILPWDESILDTLSPKLTAALSNAIKIQRGQVSRIYNFLPVKVMSYVMLPCTLPVESAFAMAQRLVMWLPDMPEDIWWLQWLTWHACSRVMAQLLPHSRSRTPAHGQQPSLRDVKALLLSLLSSRGQS